MAYELPESTWPIESGDRSAQSQLAHLKTLVDSINLSWWLHNRVWDENATGRLSYAPQGSDSLKVAATDTPSLQFKVLLGGGFLSGVPFRKLADTTNDALTAPTSDPRIDTIGIDPSTGDIVIYTGEESGSPSAPAVASGIFKAGEIYWRVDSTAIYDSEQSTGAYIQNRATLFALPGDEPHTSGISISGGAFVYDGTSGDITMPTTGRTIEFDYPGEAYIDASDADGALTFRTGGATDRLSVGKPADPIILHGSSHDLKLLASGESLLSEGPNRFMIEQYLGTGIGLRTGEVTRLTLDQNGVLTFIGSGGNVIFASSGASLASDRSGFFDIRATHEEGALAFQTADIRRLYIFSSGTIRHAGTINELFLDGDGTAMTNQGESQWIINQTGAVDGLMIQTASANRYQINAAGEHTIWGDAYFQDDAYLQNDIYVSGTLYIGGVPVTPGGVPGLGGFGAITLPGTIFEPADVGGSEGPNSAEFGSNVLLFQVFLTGVSSYCCAPNVLMPLLYNPAVAVYVRVRWSSDDETTDSVRFSIQTAPQAQGNTADQSLNAAATIVDANGGIADEMRVTEWTELNVTGILAGDAFLLRLERTGDHVGDTLAESVRVHSVDIRYFGGTIDE